jgi:dTMP kinase
VKHGRFITLEGGEGSGKTTQVRLLSEVLTARNIPHLITREPGGTKNAECLRALVVEGDAEWLPESEMLLFMAARLEHVERVIRPALREGKIVICDRFHDSSRAYQGIAKGLGITFYDQLHRLMLGDFTPDKTFLLDIDPAVGLVRAASRSGVETRFEELGLAFHTRLREGFLTLAAAEPQRIHVINATQELAMIHQQLMRHLCL